MTHHEHDSVAADNPHAPVSNEAAPAGEGDISQPMTEGADSGRGEAAPPAGEMEQVPGYRSASELRAAAAGYPAGMPEAMAGAGAPMLPPETAPSTAGLRDAGEASFGPAFAAETVHGVDDRVRINNTNVYPWRAIASLLITAQDNSQWIGTAWFIGPRTLVTAGHCVFIKNSNVPGRDGWARRIVVMPGRNGGALPYGSVTATTFRSVRGWTTSGQEEFDYGAIIIPGTLGSQTGWFGFGAYPDADLNGSTLNIAGYPGDKPSGTMWYGSNRVASLGARKVHYDIDTAGGQSGAPVWRVRNGARHAVGIHAYGGAVTNSATRITRPVFDNLMLWKA